MKKLLSTMVFIAAIRFFNLCSMDDKRIIVYIPNVTEHEETYEIQDDFNAIYATGIAKLTLQQVAKPFIKIKDSSERCAQVHYEINAKTLSVGLKDKNFTTTMPLECVVGYKRLQQLALADRVAATVPKQLHVFPRFSLILVDNAQSSFKLSAQTKLESCMVCLSNAARATVENINTEHVAVLLEDNSHCMLAGKTDTVYVQQGDKSHYDATMLQILAK